MRPISAFSLIAFLLGAVPAFADSVTLAPVSITEWKAVYGRVEARDRIPARARLGGTLVSLSVAEGDVVAQGDVLAEIVDEKLGFQLAALEAQGQALAAQLANAQTELTRGEELLAQGVTTAQRLDALRTQVDVVTGQIAALEAQRQVVAQQAAEGAVLAPVAGRVLDVPVAQGAVVMPGEAVAQIGGGGIFLRLAVPERHAANLTEGDAIQIEGADGVAVGRLVKVYPLIENGRVVADVEVAGLSDRFVDARVLVRLPVGERVALLVPEAALVTRGGVDFVGIEGAGLRAVVPGARVSIEGAAMVEVLTGLQAGDVVVADAAAAEVGHE
ncbi:MAG: efflux RND transporter periplasmic adaptor subunit [Rhodobacteraceae bacterium]|nr:efflux RND transporter periplasmic adaptor subunit [Paracoccaceae bacterium]MCZ8084913.1 efflux RND transporter periplasmic adaptor subunit [Paracoccaceae bacterium]